MTVWTFRLYIFPGTTKLCQGPIVLINVGLASKTETPGVKHGLLAHFFSPDMSGLMTPGRALWIGIGATTAVAWRPWYPYTVVTDMFDHFLFLRSEAALQLRQRCSSGVEPV